jgi:hypothetical protein
LSQQFVEKKFHIRSRHSSLPSRLSLNRELRSKSSACIRRKPFAFHEKQYRHQYFASDREEAPEERLPVTQRFSAGYAWAQKQVPEGRLNHEFDAIAAGAMQSALNPVQDVELTFAE